MDTARKRRLEKARKKVGRNQQILGSLRGGWRAKKIAGEYGLSYSWVKKLCKRLNDGDNGEISLVQEEIRQRVKTTLGKL